MKDIVVRGVNQWLRKVHQAGQTDDHAIDTTERRKAKDLGCVVPITGFQKRLVQSSLGNQLTTWLNSTVVEAARRTQRSRKLPRKLGLIRERQRP